MKKRRKRKKVKKNQTVLMDLSERIPRIEKCVDRIRAIWNASSIFNEVDEEYSIIFTQVSMERDAAYELLEACNNDYEILGHVMLMYREEFWVWMSSVIWRLFGLNFYEDALALCRHMLGMYRTDHLLFSMPLLLAANNNKEEALSSIDQNMKEFPHHPMMLMMAGDALISLGDFKGARRAFNQIDRERLDEFEMARSLEHRMDFLKRSKSRGIGSHTAS